MALREYAIYIKNYSEQIQNCNDGRKIDITVEFDFIRKIIFVSKKKLLMEK